MIRIVLDSNIIISSIFWRGKPYDVMKNCILGQYQLIISKEIIDETTNKLRTKFKFPEEKIQELVDILLTYSQLIEPTSKVEIVRDKKDNKIINCALDGRADYIVTGDKDLLELKEFKDTKIITAKQVLEIKTY